MRFNISKKNVAKYILYFNLLYVYTKAFWDFYFGSVAKLFFYGTVLISIFFCYIYILGKRNKRVVNRTVVLGATIYLFYILINGFLKCNSEQLGRGLQEYILFTFYVFSSIFLLKLSHAKFNDFKWSITMGAILSLFAVFEYVTRQGIIKDESYKIYYFMGGYSSYRARVFCESPMTLGMMLGLLFIYGAYYKLVNNDKSPFLNIQLLTIIIGIFCTSSRGPLLATLLGAFVMWFIYSKDNPLTQKKVIKWFAAGMFVFVCIIIINLTGLGVTKSTGNQFIDTAIQRTISATDTNEWGNMARLTIWDRYLKIFRDNFWTGIGIAKTSSGVSSNTYGVTESGLLKRLVETGFIGTILYYINFVLLMLVNALRKTNKSIKLHSFVIGVSVAIAFENIILQIFADVMIMYVFWFYVAICITANSNVMVGKNDKGYKIGLLVDKKTT